MTDKEFNERVNLSMEAFNAYQKELNRNFTFADFADFMFKAGAQFQGERVYQKIIDELKSVEEWGAEDWLLNEETKARILK